MEILKHSGYEFQEIKTRVTVHWGKGNNQTFRGLLDTGSELTLIPGDPKKHCDPPVRVGAYGGQVINGVLTDV